MRSPLFISHTHTHTTSVPHSASLFTVESHNTAARHSLLFLPLCHCVPLFLFFSIVQLGLSLASAVSKHTAMALLPFPALPPRLPPVLRWAHNIKHDSTRVSCWAGASHLFSLLNLKGLEYKKVFRNWKPLYWCGRKIRSWNNENKTSSWNRRAGHEMKAEADRRWTVTPVFSICVREVKLPSTSEAFSVLLCCLLEMRRGSFTSHQITLPQRQERGKKKGF